MEKTFHEPLITIGLPASATDVDLSNDGSRVAVAVATTPGAPSLCVYDTATGKQVASFADAGSFGRGVVFGRDGRCLYGLVEDAAGRTIELRRYALEGGESAPLSVYPYGEAYGLIRNQAADLLGVLGQDVQVLHDDGKAASPELVRIIHGLDPARMAHAQFPASGARVYCVGVATDQFVCWDLERNCQDGSWPAPDSYGRLVISRSGRYCIIAKHGIEGVFVLDTKTGERFMPELFSERELTNHYAFAPDESGFVYQAGARPGFRVWATQEMLKGPRLPEGRIADLQGAWEADVYAYVYGEPRLCMARMS
jgi:hypothetical protein